MKRVFAALVLTAALVSGARAADAVSLAAQQEMTENYRRLAATVEELQAAQLAQQKQISTLASELSKLREEVNRKDQNAATQESLRKLSDQILKVDESRIADNKRITEALEKLGKTITSMPAIPPVRPSVNTTVEPPKNTGGNTASTVPEEGYEYIVQSGDFLDRIVSRYRAEKIMVTRKMVMDANPTVDWNRLKIGQKIFIPKPKS